MAILPDEIWQRILEIGAETCRLEYRDLCCLSIASRRLNRLSLDPTLWAIILARDFPSPAPLPPSKSLYKTMFERDKARKALQWRRKVLNAESQLAMCKHKLTDLESMMVQENEKLKATAEEITHFERTRSASVALNVWQPEVVRGRQKQMVEQCTVPIQSRLDSLKMEFQVCKQQIATYSKAYNKEKQRCREFEEMVRSLKYQPLQGDQLVPEKSEVKIKRKKLKHSHCNYIKVKAGFEGTRELIDWHVRRSYHSFRSSPIVQAQMVPYSRSNCPGMPKPYCLNLGSYPILEDMETCSKLDGRDLHRTCIIISIHLDRNQTRIKENTQQSRRHEI